MNGRQDDWDKLLPQVEFAIDSRFLSFFLISVWQESIRCTPFYANYGFHPRWPLDCLIDEHEIVVPAAESFVEHLQSVICETYIAAQQRQQQYYNAG